MLGDGMSSTKLDLVLGEYLIDARQAALMFNIPTHWLSQAQQRHKRNIPYYRVNKLIRFKPNELHAWMEAQQPSAEEAADA